ncbi:MAG: hypothetical protein M3R51_03410 [Candidatus Eremiobacteraeota bacterium]|nr:hypothetical protein [Candidatus Eremiobacteraeota bacterium]
MKTALIAALIIVFPANSIAAEPFQVTNFSQGPLLGEISSTAQLQQDFNQNATLIAQAGERLGLSASDMATVRHEINRGGARYVTLPRHLDGMTGARGGVAFAHHNVVIPPDVHGWEVDLEKPTGTLRVFVPNRCGNVSFVMERHRILAAAPAYVTPQNAVAAAPPADVPAYQPPATPVPAAPVSVSSEPIVPAQAVAHRSFGFLPWLALGLIGVVFSSHGGSSGGSPLGPTPNQPTPTPIHTICPPPASH